MCGRESDGEGLVGETVGCGDGNDDGFWEVELRVGLEDELGKKGVFRACYDVSIEFRNSWKGGNCTFARRARLAFQSCWCSRGGTVV